MDPFFINIFVLIVVLNCLKAFFKFSAQKKREQERLVLRQANSKSTGKRQSQPEDLPALVPVEASVSPVALPVVAVVEPAPVPVVDPAMGWSKSVELPADVDVPAVIRKTGITAFECYKFIDRPGWLKFCKLREQEMLSGLGHLTDSREFFARPRRPRRRPLSISKRPAPVLAQAEPLVCL